MWFRVQRLIKLYLCFHYIDGHEAFPSPLAVACGYSTSFVVRCNSVDVDKLVQEQTQPCVHVKGVSGAVSCD